jgi:hypothetical protein
VLFLPLAAIRSPDRPGADARTPVTIHQSRITSYSALMPAAFATFESAQPRRRRRKRRPRRGII